VSKVIAALLAVAMLCVGLYLGGHPSDLPEPVRDVFVDDSASLQSEARDVIEDNFTREVPDEQLDDASLRGMVRSLRSRFSHYFTERENKLFRESTSGEFSGVGMTVTERKRGLLVVGTFKRSPARRAGIKPGDVITRVNGRSIAGRPEEQATALIKGKPGTYVRLTIDPRDGEPRTPRVRRQRIQVPVAEGRMRRSGDGRKTGVIQLASFTSGAHGQLALKIRQLERRGAEGFVLDLRGNGGGLLDEAVLVSSLFVPEGVVVSTDGRKRSKRVFHATGETITRKPVVVLVDRNTASASEIVTAALNECLGAPVVGQRTFGKGVFGQIFDLDNGGALDLVVGDYFTPTGKNLSGKGIRPSVRAVDRPATRRDEALQPALDAVPKANRRNRC
jgi:carboxyl-terminal processing protease